MCGSVSLSIVADSPVSDARRERRCDERERLRERLAQLVLEVVLAEIEDLAHVEPGAGVMKAAIVSIAGTNLKV